MQSPQVPPLKSRGGPGIQGFHHNLGRTVLFVLLLVSILPILLFGALNYYQDRDLLAKEVNKELEITALFSNNQIQQFVDLQNKALDRLANDLEFRHNLGTLVRTKPDTGENRHASQNIHDAWQANPQTTENQFFEEMVLLSQGGDVLYSTQNARLAKYFCCGEAGNQLLKSMLGTNKNLFLYHPFTGLENQMILFTSRSFIDDQGAPLATLIAATNTGQLTRSIIESGATIDGASVFFFTREGSVIRRNNNNSFDALPEQIELSAYLTPLTKNGWTQAYFRSTTMPAGPAFMFARWNANANIGILLTVPEQEVFAIGRLVDPRNLIIVLISLLILIVSVYFGSAQLLRPVSQLAQAANRFLNGSWSERVPLNRKDEIGLLAFSFNRMADELSEMHQSLEAAKDRTDQAKTASGVAGQADSNETVLLYQATRQVTQSRSEEEIIQALSGVFIQLPRMFAVFSLEKESFQLLFVTDPETGTIETGLHNPRIPAGRMMKQLQENPTVVIEDISQPSDYEDLVLFLQRRGCCSAALVRISANGQLSHVFAFGSPGTGHIQAADLQLYANLAEVVGKSLENCLVLDTLKKRLSELQILTNVSQAISAETHLNNLYLELHKQVMQTFGADLEFAIAIYHPKEGIIDFPYFYENQQLITVEPSHLGEGLTSSIIQDRQPKLFHTEQEIRAHSPIIEGQPARSWLGVPLIFASNIVGAVIIQDLQNENRFQQEDLNLFMMLAPQIATAVRNAQLYTESQQSLRAYDEEHFLLNTLLDNVPEGISFKDTYCRYIRSSDSIARTLHISADEMVGKTDYDLMDHETAERLFHEEQMVMNNGSPEIGLVQKIVSADGEERWFQMSRLPIRTPSGDPYGLMLIQREISELKKAEQLAQRRAEQVVTAAEIARDTTGTLDVASLLKKTVNLVCERFGYNHASIFLLDSQGEYAVLRESTGEAGQQMMRAGHRLAVGSKSIVGQVSSSGKSLIVNDISEDSPHLPNPLLPDTRSELAMPLRIGEHILGALDVQSNRQNAFSTEDISVLEILADQLAVAITNGNLFTRTQELLDKHRLLRNITTTTAASTNLEDALIYIVAGLQAARLSERIAILMLNNENELQIRASTGYEGSQWQNDRIAPGQGIVGQAAAEKRVILIEDTGKDPRCANIDPRVRSELAIPILFGDELLGVLNLESTRVNGFDANDQEILSALGSNLGGIIANVRLVSQVREQVIRERQLFDITNKIRHSVDIETILETSAEEIARAMGARKARIQITAGSQATDGAKRAGSDRGTVTEPVRHHGREKGLEE